MTQFKIVKEVVSILAVKDKSVYRWISKGRLNALRFGREVRIKKSTLEEIIYIRCKLVRSTSKIVKNHGGKTYESR